LVSIFAPSPPEGITLNLKEKQTEDYNIPDINHQLTINKQ